MRAVRKYSIQGLLQIYVCSLPHQKEPAGCADPVYRGGPKGPPFSVSQERHAPGGTLFCLLRRSRKTSPLVSPFWTKLSAEPRTRPKGPRTLSATAHSAQRASHTLCAQFPCRCPDRTHMSSGRDFFGVPGQPSRGGAAERQEPFFARPLIVAYTIDFFG